MTGSGKTSLINLIPRFYDVQRGAIRIDGYDLRDLQLESLRRQIGIVLQDTYLFSASIRENIAYGRAGASLDEIVEAARAAKAHEFIIDTPKGYDTLLGERGITLSGGQRQRIAITRALLMDSRNLILDDATSSVDVQTEVEIQRTGQHHSSGPPRPASEREQALSGYARPAVATGGRGPIARRHRIATESRDITQRDT